MRSFEHALPAATAEAELLALVARLNADPAVDGILVQLPLPPQIDAQKVIEAIDPAKDVDGFHPINAGRAHDRRAGPRLLHAARAACCSSEVGAAATLPASTRWWSAARTSSASRWRSCCSRESCTVTMAHSQTPRPAGGLPRAPTSSSPPSAGPRWCAATGSSPAPSSIDVGINRVPDPAAGEGKTRIVGDVAFAEARAVASADHAGAGRRRPDDHRLPAAQHPRGRLPAARPADAGAPGRPMIKTNPGRFFEDFALGETIRHATPRTVTAADAALSTALYGSRFAVQSSDAFAPGARLSASPLDDLLVFHIVFGKTVPDISLNAVANLGYADGRFLKPVYPGATLSAVVRGDRPQGELERQDRHRLRPLDGLRGARRGGADLLPLGARATSAIPPPRSPRSTCPTCRRRSIPTALGDACPALDAARL